MYTIRCHAIRDETMRCSCILEGQEFLTHFGLVSCTGSFEDSTSYVYIYIYKYIYIYIYIYGSFSFVGLKANKKECALWSHST